MHNPNGLEVEHSSLDRDSQLNAADQVTGRTVAWIEECIRRFPKREACSDDEQRMLRWIEGRLKSLGLQTQSQAFLASVNLYRVILAHVVLALVGLGAFYFSRWGWFALCCHAGAALLYVLESNKKFPLLRCLFPKRPTSNVWGTIGPPPSRRISHRIVLLAHVDAAPTGLMFHPFFVRSAAKSLLPQPFAAITKRQMLLLVICFIAIALIDVVYLATGYIMVINCGIAAVVLLICAWLLGELAFWPRIVPGANDNLTGCAAVMAIAERIKITSPDNVEWWFVFNAAEESGNCGAREFVKTVAKSWDRDNTLVLAIDSVGSGDLQYHVEGEFVPLPLDTRVLSALHAAARQSSQWSNLAPYYAPAGATDAAPFIRAGFQAVAFARIDAELGAPSNYHRPSDVASNLNAEAIDSTIEFVLAVCNTWVQARESSAQTNKHETPSINR